MAPIRVGIIGLNASSSWAVSAHLPYLLQSSKYVITALCNSSVEKAQESIKAHSLPESVKAYGSPDDLANDPDVDLVVCSVRVDRHYETLLPSVKAGKDVFSEWPLGKNLQEAKELAILAKEKGSRTLVGLQATRSLVVNKVKQLIEQGRIGKVLSTTFIASAYNGGPQESQGVQYLNDRSVGGNLVTIHFAHSIDGVLYALGDELSSFNSILETQRKTIEITDKAIDDPSRKVIGTVSRDSFDQVLLQGHLSSGALFSYHLRGGKHFAPGEGLVWRIYGEKGEITVTGPSSHLQFGSLDDRVRISGLDGGEPEEVQWKEDQELKGRSKEGGGEGEGKEINDNWSSLVGPAPTLARLYESFADAKTGDYRDWEHALVRHALIEELYEREAQGQQDIKARYVQA